MKIGILGGTFNPIHSGHLTLARQAADLLGLDKIIFIPCYTPPHKSAKGVVSAAHRLRMVRLAIGDNPRFVVSDIEAKIKRKSYTINTLKKLRKIFLSHAEFFLIVGSDAIEELPRWKGFKEVQKLAKVIVAIRPGFRAVKKPYFSRLIKITPLDISSSAIRRMIKKGVSIRYLVPKAVERYISKNRLYK